MNGAQIVSAQAVADVATDWAITAHHYDFV
jgi:hypothetical protein